MPAWLSISLLLGGTAVAIRAIVAVRRVAHAGRQRSHEKRLERDARSAIRKRMRQTETGTSSRLVPAQPVDTRVDRAHLNLHTRRGDNQ